MAPSARIAVNLHEVQERICDAARRSGRRREEIKLVGVTKYVDDEAAKALIAAGCQELGESRPQSLWSKAEALAGTGARWHLIGHLQRNKVRRTLPYLALLQSLDSLALASAVSAEAQSMGRRLPVLLEVKIAADPAKHGFPPGELRQALTGLGELSGIDIRGLMTMASLEGGADAARRDFDELRTLRDALRTDSPDSISLDELSMGMSGDYEVAIESGATIVRVGSALFEGIA